MSNTVKIVFFSDAGHGWGRVTRNMINELNWAKEVSPYSYQQNGYVYLEEDWDLPRFIDVLHTAGLTEEIVYQEPVERSHIRRMPGYNALNNRFEMEA
jgi:hypothetical protein